MPKARHGRAGRRPDGAVAPAGVSEPGSAALRRALDDRDREAAGAALQAAGARRDRLEIGDFPGRDAGGHSVPPRCVRRGAQKSQTYMGRNGPAGMCIASASWGELRSDPSRQTGRGRDAGALLAGQKADHRGAGERDA
jgi:hypothetical protein